MKPQIIVSNSTQYNSREVEWLVNFAYRQVQPVAEREGWLQRLESKPISIRVTKTSSAFCGRYLSCPQAASIARPFKRPSSISPADYVRDILVRVGDFKKFPVADVYPRYKDMPEGRFDNWMEALIGVSAHELAHTKYSGNREGEFNCELVSQDAVAAFRGQLDAYAAKLESWRTQDDQRQVCMAAKQSPSAILTRELTKAQDAVAKWERRAKLAATKLKKYRRTLARLHRKQAASGTEN